LNYRDIEPNEQAWCCVLEQLLDRARVALEQSPAERAAVADDLTRFIAASPIAFQKLDAIARQAADVLLDRSIGDALKRIAERSTELSRHLASFDKEAQLPSQGVRGDSHGEQ
jgi:hypothetical protein